MDVPAFVNLPNLGTTLSAARISTANTNRDGTGTLATLLTGGASGTRIERVNVKAISTTTAGVVRLYIADSQGTPNIRLVAELLVTAITPSTTVKTWEGELVRTDGQPLFLIPAGWTLRASTHNAESFDALVTAGDF